MNYILFLSEWDKDLVCKISSSCQEAFAQIHRLGSLSSSSSSYIQVQEASNGKGMQTHRWSFRTTVRDTKREYPTLQWESIFHICSTLNERLSERVELLRAKRLWILSHFLCVHAHYIHCYVGWYFVKRTWEFTKDGEIVDVYKWNMCMICERECLYMYGECVM